MGKAARAIIIEDNKLLLMRRIKDGSQYFTLVGGRLKEGESVEQALIREVKEETGLTITRARQVFFEEHPEPYNEQYIYLCEIGPHEGIAIQTDSEEDSLNKEGMNIHELVWAYISAFPDIAFRTPQLQKAIIEGIKKGFPAQPIKI